MKIDRTLSDVMLSDEMQVFYNKLKTRFKTSCNKLRMKFYCN